MFDEEYYVTKYDPYLSNCAAKYLRLTNQPKHMYEDIKSEASIAFVKAIRELHPEEEKLTPQEYVRIHNRVRNAMRTFVWRSNGYKDKNNPMTDVVVRSFSDTFSADNEDYVSKLLTCDEDFSGLEVEEMLSGLSANERAVITLTAQGYSQVEISRIRGISDRTVRRIVDRLKEHFKEAS